MHSGVSPCEGICTKHHVPWREDLVRFAMAEVHVISHKDLSEAQVKRAAKDQASEGKGKCGRKRDSPAPEPKTKVAPDERSVRAIESPGGADGSGRLDCRMRDGESVFSLDLFEAGSRRPRPVAVQLRVGLWVAPLAQ